MLRSSLGLHRYWIFRCLDSQALEEQKRRQPGKNAMNHPDPYPERNGRSINPPLRNIDEVHVEHGDQTGNQ